jgi:hypothetical protein
MEKGGILPAVCYESAAMDGLIEDAWRIYRKFEDNDVVVKPSIPILFFGNSDAYFASPIKIITVGLNPSRIEFPNEDRFLRFDWARNISEQTSREEFRTGYRGTLNAYFRSNPYKQWFNSLEPLLNGLECSYYSQHKNVAIHTDLFSPLATDPTWSKLPKSARSELESDGLALWHRLVEYLEPDFVVVSVAKRYLEAIRFALEEDGTVLSVISRKNPYVVVSSKIRIGNAKIARLIFGPAAQTPFGKASSEDKKRIGRAAIESLYER